jgi:guanine deaminase
MKSFVQDTSLKAIRASFLHFTDVAAYEYFEDGLLVIANGKVVALGEYHTLKKQYAQVAVTDHSGKLVVPGFVDSHVHYPQTEMTASYGEALLPWLEKYTFPVETKFANADYARKAAAFFLDELLKNGTTTALVFGTVHPVSAAVFFEEAQKRRLRMICGKVLMDRNAPQALLDTPQTAYTDSKALIEKWHGVDRLLYAVTPRFAVTSSNEQLAVAKQLLDEHPDVYFHTHLSENKTEVDLVKQLFPESENYLGVYDQWDLLRKRSVFAHGIHLSGDEFDKLHTHQCSLAFCPTSNLFLGSGLFDYHTAKQKGIRVGLGTDLGAGTSMSMLQTLQDAYKVIQLRKAFTSEESPSLSPLEALYLATLGGAKALHLEHHIGNFLPGKEADFVVLHWEGSALLQHRLQHCTTLEEKLFALQMLGDERAVYKTYILGEAVV